MKASVYYEIIDNTYAVVTGCGKGDEIVIECLYDGFEVAAIAPNAFRYRSGLKRVIIPSTIREIGDGSFCFCQDLEYIGTDPDGEHHSHLPVSVKIIGSSAFCATELVDVTLESAVVVLGSACFMDCFSLNRVAFPHALELTMGKRAFYNSGITVFYAPLAGISQIPEEIFGHCDIKDCVPPELIAKSITFMQKEPDFSLFADKYTSPADFPAQLEGVFQSFHPGAECFIIEAPESHKNTVMIPCFGTGSEILMELVCELARYEARILINIERVGEEYFKVRSMEPTADAASDFPHLQCIIQQAWKKAGIQNVTPKENDAGAKEILAEFHQFLNRYNDKD